MNLLKGFSRHHYTTDVKNVSFESVRKKSRKAQRGQKESSELGLSNKCKKLFRNLQKSDYLGRRNAARFEKISSGNTSPSARYMPGQDDGYHMPAEQNLPDSREPVFGTHRAASQPKAENHFFIESSPEWPAQHRQSPVSSARMETPVFGTVRSRAPLFDPIPQRPGLDKITSTTFNQMENRIDDVQDY